MSKAFNRFYPLFFSLCLLIFIFTCFIGCDQSFQPLKENTQYHFSIYGFLDASADTQWVRVTPAREQLSTDTIPEMTVTLEEVETGNRSVMHDSLFQPAYGNNFVNVWSTMEIKPAHTYRLVAERPDGATSSVTVTTPPDFPAPTLEFPFPNRCLGRLTIQGVERLADVHWRYYYKLNSDGYMRERFFRFWARSRFSKNSSGNYEGILDPNADHINPLLPEGEIVESKRTVFVAAGGPEWNEEIPSIEDLEYALPETASNIKNGVGYMLGIVSKTIPFECHVEYP